MSSDLPPADPYEQRVRVNDLRVRVLDGYDPTPEEMLTQVNLIRQDRRAAARATTSAVASRKPKANPGKPVTVENLRDILDQDL